VKREHFEMLWNACSGKDIGYLADEEKNKIPKEIWDGWRKKRIIGYSTIPKEAFLPQYDLSLPARIERIEDSDECWATPQDQQSGGRFRIPKSEVEQHAVFIEDLIHHIATEWGLEPKFKIAPPKGILIGLKDNEIPVVVLYETLENPIIQAYSIRENLGVSKLIIIRIRETNLSIIERKQLTENGITFWGTTEFLSKESIPQWELQYLPITGLQLTGTPWAYNSDTDTYLFNGQTIKLSPLRKKLLNIFLRNLNVCIKKNKLIEVLYLSSQSSIHIYSHLTDQIHLLKKALPTKAKEWLVTIPREGYGLFNPNQSEKIHR